MADGTHIEWTEATWNPITGCSLASPGCTNCYAMKLAGTRLAQHPSRAGLTQDSRAGPVWTGEVRFNEQWLDQPLRWKRPRMIFVCAHGDLFHESVPDAWIDRIFAVMALCPQHTFQVLTKRSARMREYLRHRWQEERAPENWNEAAFYRVHGAAEALDLHRYQASNIGGCNWWPLPNVWLGVSVEDQQRADERIPDLLATPAAVRWISAEPLLGPVSIIDAMWARDAKDLTASIDWVVVGGESGAGARPMHPDWARSLRNQCAAAGVPFFFKQWGEWYPAFANDYVVDATSVRETRDIDGAVVHRIGKKRAGRLLDGVEHNGMPKRS
ncbi:phage Gp37/Gp68 family protein [Erythrobacter sp. NE805]|uniref:phage Gp37/Gp68 family protein n=1 Tax=Erythrobacter sp. NE805 TaxID=3389875 RepID=UPI00396B259F